MLTSDLCQKPHGSLVKCTDFIRTIRFLGFRILVTSAHNALIRNYIVTSICVICKKSMVDGSREKR